MQRKNTPPMQIMSQATHDNTIYALNSPSLHISCKDQGHSSAPSHHALGIQVGQRTANTTAVELQEKY